MIRIFNFPLILVAFGIMSVNVWSLSEKGIIRVVHLWLKNTCSMFSSERNLLTQQSLFYFLLSSMTMEQLIFHKVLGRGCFWLHTRRCCCGSSLVDGLIDNVSFCIVTCDGNSAPAIILLVLYHGAANSCTVVFDDLSKMADGFWRRLWIFRNISSSCVLVLVEPSFYGSSDLSICIGTIRPGFCLVDILTSIWKCCCFEAFIMLKFALLNVELGKIFKLSVPRLDI